MIYLELRTVSGEIHRVPRELAFDREILFAIVNSKEDEDVWIDCEDHTSVRWSSVESVTEVDTEEKVYV